MKTLFNTIYNQVLREGRESKNMSLAKHYLYTKKNYSEEEALKVIGAIKTDIPNVRLQKCKFILGVTRMFCDGQLSDGSVIMGLNKCLKFVASDAHVNEYNENLNDMSADDVIERFSTNAQQELNNDKENLSKTDYNINNDYTIVPIDSFEEAEKYGEYTSWCVTHYRNMYDSYTSNGMGIFYFCLKDGFEHVECVRSDNCPLDEYGLSMIAVSVNSDGSCNTITCRWNHDNRGNDHIMTTEQLSNLIGQNFYDAFKPFTEEETKVKESKIFNELLELSRNMEVWKLDKVTTVGSKKTLYTFGSDGYRILLNKDKTPVTDILFRSGTLGFNSVLFGERIIAMPTDDRSFYYFYDLDYKKMIGGEAYKCEYSYWETNEITVKYGYLVLNRTLDHFEVTDILMLDTNEFYFNKPYVAMFVSGNKLVCKYHRRTNLGFLLDCIDIYNAKTLKPVSVGKYFNLKCVENIGREVIYKLTTEENYSILVNKNFKPINKLRERYTCCPRF